jgi:hypothetical protein
MIGRTIALRHSTDSSINQQAATDSLKTTQDTFVNHAPIDLFLAGH